MRQISAKRKAHKASDEGKAGHAHMALVARLPCVICASSPVQVHHVIHGRYSARKSSDMHTIPLCPPCHAELHAGKETWAAKHGPDYTYLPIVADKIARGGGIKNPRPKAREVQEEMK
jgi:hypothetical protein